MHIGKRIIKLSALIVWASLIFYLSSIESLKTPYGIWDLYLRKAAHIIEYAILFLLIYINLSPGVLTSRIAALIITFLYAASDEYHQSFVPGRHFSYYDIIIDTIGALMAYLSVIIGARKRS